MIMDSVAQNEIAKLHETLPLNPISNALPILPPTASARAGPIAAPTDNENMSLGSDQSETAKMRRKSARTIKKE
jgi:hypothetical protein